MEEGTEDPGTPPHTQGPQTSHSQESTHMSPLTAFEGERESIKVGKEKER